LKKTFLFGLAFAVALAGCAEPSTRAQTADKVEEKKTQQLAAEAARQAGVPNITNFTEKKFMKLIYELRDRELSTYSYFMDFQGRLFLLCESVGYGVSASTQYVNPERIIEHEGYGTGGADWAVAVSQAEPNGMHMPEGLSATYVLCSDGAGGVAPVYSEPNLIVSPFRLKAAIDLRAEQITSDSVDATWAGETPVGAPEDQTN